MCSQDGAQWDKNGVPEVGLHGYRIEGVTASELQIAPRIGPNIEDAECVEDGSRVEDEHAFIMNTL
jgi:hypothetical protein